MCSPQRRAHLRQRVGSCEWSSALAKPPSFPSLFIHTCCAIRRDTSWRMMATTRDPLLTTWAIAICNQRRDTQRSRKEGLRNSGKTNEVGQTEACQQTVWPFHHDRTATSDHGYGKLITFAEFGRAYRPILTRPAGSFCDEAFDSSPSGRSSSQVVLELAWRCGLSIYLSRPIRVAGRSVF